MKTWWKESVIYQIYPKSFYDSNGDGIGDLKGIILKLDYLKELGIDIIWLSPVYASPQVDNGYDISDYQAISKEYGTMEDFDCLLKEAHQRGIKVVMDLVVNHTSNQHPWFIESRKSKDNPYRDYYIWKEGKNHQAPNNWESVFSGSSWQYDKQTDMYYLHLYSDKQPDLNWENEDVRNDIYKMMRWWLDKGIDGFRMDVINKLSKVQTFQDVFPQTKKYMRPSKYVSNGPRIHEFLKEMNQKALSHYDVMTVGEITSCTIEQAKQYTGENEHELSMLFQFEHTDVDAGPYGKWTPVPLDLVKLKKILTKWQYGLQEEGWNSLFWDNHDQPRVLSRFGNLDYMQDSAKMLATTLHFLKGTPYIYQGEEIGMTNYPFTSLDEVRDVEVFNAYQDLVKDKKALTHEQMMKGICASSRDNARTPMQWNNENNAGFTTGNPWINVNPNYKTINVHQQLLDPNSIFHYYQKLIQLRHQMPIIVYGTYELLEENHPDLYIYTRTYQDEKLLVINNFSSHEYDYELKEFRYSQLLISNDQCDKIHDILHIKPYGCYALLQKM
ncbi:MULTISPECIES: alpha-glucosidase [Coprobacillaceae]|uniref:glycoside hydrolase family 13 protein n=1 Tax=Coprobacillaceae TaxID=2810280 RepID=UPI000E51F845|nr:MULTISPECIES: alpha-glucosidase [Coprobacillaceae]RHM63187.1 alpha-glucosidase [Coprobacillus sp. AF33-1AC]RHS93875.1 alpha-glucosidase [Erysipelatoclostridium sp. AM42-17]